jgi:hypothetical protein
MTSAYVLLADRYGVLVDCRVPLNPAKTKCFPYEKLTLFGLQEITGCRREPENPTWEYIVGLTERMLLNHNLPTKALQGSRRWVVTPDQPDMFQRVALELYLAKAIECTFTAGRDLVCSRENLIASLRTMTTLMTDVELFPESTTVTREQIDRAKGRKHEDICRSSSSPTSCD